MCGRFTLASEPRHVEMRFGAKFITTDFEPTYNAAPSQLLPGILGRNPLGSSNREIVLARWGFQPAWAKHWRPRLVDHDRLSDRLTVPNVQPGTLAILV